MIVWFVAQSEQRERDVPSVVQSIKEHQQRYFERAQLDDWQREQHDSAWHADSREAKLGADAAHLAAKDLVRARLGEAYSKAKQDLVLTASAHSDHNMHAGAYDAGAMYESLRPIGSAPMTSSAWRSAMKEHSKQQEVASSKLTTRSSLHASVTARYVDCSQSGIVAACKSWTCWHDVTLL